MMHTRNQELPRLAMLERGEERGLSAIFIGTVDDIKALAQSSGYRVIYMLRITNVARDAPGYMNWLIWQNKVDPELVGNA